MVVDDDIVARMRTQHYFQAQGYPVSVAQNGTEMWRIMATHPAALILLDVGLPGKSGIELARELRAHDDYLGIILVTSHDDDTDKIVGLESGANDYVTKPFNSRELLARVRIVLRETHQRRPEHLQSIRQLGRWTVNLTQRYVADENGERLALSRGEMEILVALARLPGEVLSRTQLMQYVSHRPGDVSERTVDVLVSRLRRKLESDPSSPSLIVTLRGEGYTLRPCPEQPDTHAVSAGVARGF